MCVLPAKNLRKQTFSLFPLLCIALYLFCILSYMYTTCYKRLLEIKIKKYKLLIISLVLSVIFSSISAMSWREQISQIISRAKTFVYKTIGLYVQIKNHYKDNIIYFCVQLLIMLLSSYDNIFYLWFFLHCKLKIPRPW